MSNNRDRAMRVEIKQGTKQELIEAISQFIGMQDWGRIRFEKEGESFSMLATSEVEPSASS
jgi:hypothetical protein